MQTQAKMDACRGEFKIVPAGVVGFKTGELRGQIRIIRKAHPDNDKVFKFSGQLSAVCEQTPFAALHKIFFLGSESLRGRGRRRWRRVEIEARVASQSVQKPAAPHQSAAVPDH